MTDNNRKGLSDTQADTIAALVVLATLVAAAVFFLMGATH